ncbi:hypothetical protein A1O7_00153 [Cladophialophora yegresii CBS 114405]|uniref:Nuclear fusion protein KAR5 n=1 Tax=Cladophialophora yegresii CBS 114405 TaxID=1182544 RepID=W9W754_9EURO|nr:uncharacterized protein A1O7_00153 [Cladophialophora yegresii CBS 114405]EXJ63818.1 hypothetical protein A1O7_00153 [Cladophialophora yegresii CBS 114405]
MLSSGHSLVPSILRRLLLASVVAFIGHTHAKFLKADLKWPVFWKPHNELQPSLTDVLALREPDTDPVFEKAMHMVTTLATQSTCHQAAAAQLLVTCKTVGANMAQEDGKHELLERAKSVYAVRVAVCETGEGRAEVPSACKSILTIPQRLDHEIDVVSSRTVAPCLGALMEEHYYWTSYSNNKQDANTLCQASTLESTRLEALHSYQKLAELLPEFRIALSSTRSQWLDFLRQQKEEVQHVHKLQRQYRDGLQAQQKVELGSFRESMKVAKNGLLDISEGLHQALASTDSDISQAREALRGVLADFTGLKMLLQETAAKTSENNAELVASQTRDIANVHDLALSATRALENVHVEAFAEDVHGLVHQLKTNLDQMAGIQSMQLDDTLHHFELSKELSSAQEANLVLGQRIKDSAGSIASELENAHTAAGRVSTKLDRVNQALAHIEAATASLGTFFAIITIPCQMVGRLHLRLLALFAAPASMLLFWKPMKYSCTVMATYTFLETMISLAHENRVTASTALARLGHHSRAITQSGTIAFHNSVVVVVAAIVTIFCCYCLLAIRTRPKQKSRPKPKPIHSLTFKSIQRLDELTASERNYDIYRLRHGKRQWRLADKVPRAATVC